MIFYTVELHEVKESTVRGGKRVTETHQACKSLICITQTFCDGDTFAQMLTTKPAADGQQNYNLIFLTNQL